ncbi:TIGR03013 family PEP-CTERM/XrtA system glycosyltransferase [Altericroceibacterium spongiae]|uniref:TIGR03013 family PEP-CTERM/XrtA system glycosyltransferase n=1 Tax=Altericroceibacterium spongiae TaxID=2320269 RepID=A0A420ERD8_9SPHN|nr:TIGR03013 family XrtA/PEP-CTERM system glycosyltransferase [Altericroceibacterium spongiae]RKF23210.1 TIGR03013 family PEP-CTERM/XrtA system glycosyltransferase [Altericroceibacterium spongiae]
MVRLFKHYVPRAVLFLGVVDFVLLLAANDIAWQVRASQIGIDLSPMLDRVGAISAFAVVVMLAMVSVGVYGPDALRSLRYAAARLLIAVSLAVLSLAFIDFIIPSETFWRSTLLYAMGITIILLMINRLILGKILGNSAFRRRVLVLGAGARAERLNAIAKRLESGFVIVGFVGMGEEGEVIAGKRNRADIPDLSAYVRELEASEVVLALQERRNALPLQDLLRIKTEGVYVTEFSSFVERETGRVDLETVNPSWLIFSDGFSSGHRLSKAIKRVFDIVVSSVLLLLTFPIILLFAVLVKIDSKGPAFYRQQRVGLYGQPFDVIKLRSMRIDAERDGAKWAEKNDPRVTRIGRFIRMVRIDELPQTWSVLKGDMSFVGPRPERRQFVDELELHLRYYAERHMVKPGITGWAQINYPYGASIEDARQKLEYDLYYAKNYTPFLDLLIILQTLRVILWPEGAR